MKTCLWLSALFLIVAAAIFSLIKFMNSITRRKKAPAQAPVPAAPVIPNEERLLTEIRDILKSRNSAQS